MLFLLNDQIIEIDIPEAHLAKRAHVLGCGDPHMMRARDAIDYAGSVMTAIAAEGAEIEMPVAEDLAALVIAKTGANAALFPNVGGEPRLTILPEAILEQLKSRAEQTGTLDLASVWPLAA